jgi:hypothetical protein
MAQRRSSFISFSVLLINYALPFCAQPSFDWAATVGSQPSEENRRVFVDVAANIYIIGSFSSTVDFDPGPGTFNLSAAGEMDAYVLKLSPSGNFIWAVRLGGSSYERASDISGDSFGNIYVVGSYSTGTIDLDPGPNTYSLSTTQDGSNFIVKLNSNGGFIWASSFGGANSFAGSWASRIILDNAGALLIGGSFNSVQDFNPGPGTFTLAGQSASFYFDGYLLKLNQNGAFISVLQLRGLPGKVGITDITVDGLGNAFVAGTFDFSVDFDPGSGVHSMTSPPSPNNDGFILKLSSNGSFAWAGQLGDNDNTNGSGFASIHINSNGQLIACGVFRGNVDLDPGTATYAINSSTLSNTFISAINPASGSLIWSKTFSSDNNVPANSFLDQFDNIYACGSYQGGTDFDPGVSTVTMTSGNPNRAYVVKLDPTGNFLWGLNTGGSPQWSLHSLSGDIYVSGLFSGTVNLNPGPSSSTFTSAGLNDVFLYKLSECGDVPSLSINPLFACAGNTATLNASAAGTVSWYSSATGSTSIGSGNTFITPTLSVGGYTYFAASSNCTVEGTRLPVIVIVNSLPALTLAVSKSTVCEGSAITLSATGADSFTVNGASAILPLTFTPTALTTITVVGKDSSTGCFSSKTQSVAGMPCLSVIENLFADLYVFPGASNSKVIIQSVQERSIRITDLYGKTVADLVTTPGNNVIDISSWPAGIYLIFDKKRPEASVRLIKE